MKKDISNKTNNNDIAISVKNVSKTFRIPHEKVTSIKGAVAGALNRNKDYEEFKALDDVSFEVKKGEFFACPQLLQRCRRGIIGRNGSKLALLKILTNMFLFDIIKVLKPPVLTFWHGGVLFSKK